MALRPGESVLDLARGTGFAVRAAAAHAGPTGQVCGTDLNEGMRKVAAVHHPDTEFTAAPADRLPFSGATFGVAPPSGPDFAAAGRTIADRLAEHRPRRSETAPFTTTLATANR